MKNVRFSPWVDTISQNDMEGCGAGFSDGCADGWSKEPLRWPDPPGRQRVRPIDSFGTSVPSSPARMCMPLEAALPMYSETCAYSDGCAWNASDGKTQWRFSPDQLAYLEELPSLTAFDEIIVTEVQNDMEDKICTRAWMCQPRCVNIQSSQPAGTRGSQKDAVKEASTCGNLVLVASTPLLPQGPCRMPSCQTVLTPRVAAADVEQTLTDVLGTVSRLIQGNYDEPMPRRPSGQPSTVRAWPQRCASPRRCARPCALSSAPPQPDCEEISVVAV